MNELFMRRALELARLGMGRTSPNPPVGAVVVRNGAIVGEGYHRAVGTPHAERIALEHAGEAAQGAGVYVSLEPCCHHGRTPPCTEALIEAGVSQVIYASPDPDPRCHGGGHTALEAAGIHVEAGVLQEDAAKLLEGYVRHKRTGLPLVTLKLAMSLDGKIATRTGNSQWITGEESRRLVHRMRDEADAVMVGVGTVLADNPSLTTRRDGGGRDSLRVVVDSMARTSPEAAVVVQESTAGCLVACTEHAAEADVQALRGAGAEVLILPAGNEGVDLKALMAELGARGALNVLIEGGGSLAWGALSAGIVDRIAFFYAPVIIGGDDAVAGVGGLGFERVDASLRLSDLSLTQTGVDLLVEGYLTPRAELRCSPD